MTTQSILVLVGIVSLFATFAIAVAWADFYSQRRPRPVDEAAPVAREAPRTLHDERRAA